MISVRRDNYRIQAEQAKRHFLTYDQAQLIRKCKLDSDGNYLYVNFLCKRYRIHRGTADIAWQDGSLWQDGNSYNEVMTLLDLLCDSREDRHPAGTWQSMESFGRAFHRSLLEKRDPFAQRIQAQPEAFRSACRKLGGSPIDRCDMGYRFSLFDTLPVGLQFWFGDEEFSPRVRWLWDANAGQYLRYETMYFAIALIEKRIAEGMAV